MIWSGWIGNLASNPDLCILIIVPPPYSPTNIGEGNAVMPYVLRGRSDILIRGRPAAYSETTSWNATSQPQFPLPQQFRPFLPNRFDLSLRSGSGFAPSRPFWEE